MNQPMQPRIAKPPASSVERLRLCILVLSLFVLPGVVSAQGLDATALRRKQDDQEKARAMTRALLDGVLALQLRQLEDNGLVDLPAYREITAMRGHLTQIVDDEMSQVVRLLASSQTGTPAERDAAFIAARKAVRDVVTKLSAERQALLKRLKVAELAEQVQRLVALQTQSIATTDSIAKEAKSQQEALTLAVQEDQRDIKQLFLHLVETLTDVQTWGGAAATTALDGLRVLKAADVGQHVDRAVAELEATKFEPAREHQTGVIRGLDELLRLIQRNQGLLAGEHRDAVQRLRTLAERQQQLREETRRLPTQSDPTPEFVDRQVQLRRELADFAQSLPALPTARQLADQAGTAADRAGQQLFDGHTPEAVEQQSQVLGNLAALEDVLQRGLPDPRTDRTAAELANTVRQLESTKSKLQAAAEKQERSLTESQTEVARSKAVAPEIVKEVAAAKDAADLSTATAALLDDAERAVRTAAEAIKDGSGPATESQQRALVNADRALDRALAAVDADLQEARRQADAVKIGEVARAAEALERAAAEERSIIQRLEQVSTADATAADIAALAGRQDHVAAIASKVSEALAEIAPANAAAIAQAAEQATAARQPLQAAAAEQAKRKLAAEAALTPAKSAAEQLSAAASGLRQIAQQAAQELADRSASQAEALSAAAEDVEKLQSPTAMSLVDQLARLQQARQQTDAAARQQQRASGRPAAAEGLELAAELATAQALQEAAHRAAAAFDRGESPTVLAATTAQQAAADAMQMLSEDARERPAFTPRVADLVDRAQSAAAQAAKQMLDGRVEAAAKFRATAMQALVAARQEVAGAAQRAMQAASTSPPEVLVQRQAAKSAAAAEKLAQGVAPLAAEMLKTSQAAGELAASHLDRQQPVEAQAAQRQAEDALSLAQGHLDQALERIRMAQAQSLTEQAEAVSRQIAPTSQMESGAAAALEAAAAAARSATKASATAEEQATAAQSAERQLQRATATLSAKSEELRRDQAIAEALAASAQSLQEAVKTLATQRSQASESPASANTDQARQAAQQFAESQRATGQGAAELSGQQQVVNPPLREALQKAAELVAAQMARAITDAEAADHPEVGASPADPSQPATGDNDGQPVADNSQTPTPGQPKKASPSNRPPSSPPMDDTGFVSQSPELTAQMLAGPDLAQAMQAADQNQGQATKPSDGKASQRQQAQLDTNSTSQPSSNQSPSSASQSEMQAAKPGGETKNNTAAKDGPAQKPQDPTEIGDNGSGRRTGDADVTVRAYEDQPWFAKLPPELRKSIRAGSQQKAPKAYEDRLRRYFQSVE